MDRGIERDVAARVGTILLAEDQQAILRMAQRALEKAGYEVLAARDGVAALELADEYEGPIDLVLTDVLMPRMGGIELAAALRTRDPKVKLILMSGHADLATSAGAEIPKDAVEFQKPFSIAALVETVRKLLEPARS